jgi:hypothetical protein
LNTKSRLKLSSILFSTLIFAVGCSNETEEPTDIEDSSTLELQNNCDPKYFEEGSRWIKGQLNAFSDPDPKVAYGFASADFRATNSIDQFASIITNQYSMLLDLEKFEIYSCDSSEDYFVFGVKVTGNDGKAYWMEYLLSRIDGAWGVDGATLAPEAQT